MKKHKNPMGVVITDWDLTMVHPHTIGTMVTQLNNYNSIFTNALGGKSAADVAKSDPDLLQAEKDRLLPILVSLATGLIKRQAKSLQQRKALLEDVNAAFYFGVASFNDGLLNITRGMKTVFGYTDEEVNKFNQMVADDLGISLPKARSLSTGPGYIKQVWDIAWENEPKLKSMLPKEAIEAEMPQGPRSQHPKAKHEMVKKLFKQVKTLDKESRFNISHLYVFEDSTDNIQELDKPASPNAVISLPNANTVEFRRDLSEQECVGAAHKKFLSDIRLKLGSKVSPVIPTLKKELELRNEQRANAVVKRFLKDSALRVNIHGTTGDVTAKKNVLLGGGTSQNKQWMTAKDISQFITQLNHLKEKVINDPEYHTGVGGFGFFPADHEKCYVLNQIRKHNNIQSMNELLSLNRTEVSRLFREFKADYIKRNPLFALPPLQKSIPLDNLSHYDEFVARQLYPIDTGELKDLIEVDFHLIEEFMLSVREKINSGELRDSYLEGFSILIFAADDDVKGAVPQLMDLMKMKSPLKFFETDISVVRKVYEERLAIQAGVIEQKPIKKRASKNSSSLLLSSKAKRAASGKMDKKLSKTAVGLKQHAKSSNSKRVTTKTTKTSKRKVRVKK